MSQGALLILYRALLILYRALLKSHRALLTEFSALAGCTRTQEFMRLFL